MEGLMLIVDDEEVNREILRVLFEDQYDVIDAENGEEALDILERCQGSIDVVLLDLMMPGIDGLELLRRRQKLDYFRDVPVVVISSSDHMEDQLNAFELGASDYILKPFVPQIVVSRINNVMASAQRLLSVEIEARKLRIKSELDEMTGLYNKATTELMIAEHLQRCEGQLHALLVIDIDNFKAVNDTSGHQAGDHVIRIVADLISGRFRKSDVVGRIGGDEFCVLMVDVPSMAIVHAKANELIQLMRYKPNLTIPEYVTLSIGVSSNDRKPCGYTDLFTQADEALYAAKTSGKAQYQEYGMAHESSSEDQRPRAVLLSANRSVCSTVQALVPAGLRVQEVLRIEELAAFTEEQQRQAAFLYADVSDAIGDTASFWQQLAELDWLDMNRVFAICQEGCVSQYIAALKAGVCDMFTTPIDDTAFKRRTIRQMEQLGLIDKNV